MRKLDEIQISEHRNKVLLEHNHVHLCIVSGCFMATRAQLSSCSRECVTQEA